MFAISNLRNTPEITYLMTRILSLSTILTLFTFSFCTKTETQPKGQLDIPEGTPPAKKIVYSFAEDITWSDEFDEDGLPDSDIWGYDIGGNGWGNNESQFYTSNKENARVENGNLVIEAIKNKTSPLYTSARLVTKNKKDFLYGRIEVKAKLPVGRGTWAAIWTLATKDTYGNAYWPDNGEIDIMEHVGMDQDRVHTNIHTKAYNHINGTNKGANKVVKNASTEFHVYRLDWYPNVIEFYIDDSKLFEFKKYSGQTYAEWPFDRAQHLLLNIAVGGSWGGQQGIDDSIFPQKMLVDYVRYYELVETEVD